LLKTALAAASTRSRLRTASARGLRAAADVRYIRSRPRPSLLRSKNGPVSRAPCPADNGEGWR
jgi:hypothetical protein